MRTVHVECPTCKVKVKRNPRGATECRSCGAVLDEHDPYVVDSVLLQRNARLRGARTA